MELAAVIVQAGGTGARLGGASKPDYVVGGRRLLDIFFDELAGIGFSGKTVVIAPDGVKVPEGVVRTLEDPPGGGPLPGVAAGLAELDLGDDAVVGLATCDAPLAPRLYPWLLERVECDGVVPANCEGWPQYLHGVYRLSALRALTFERHGSIRGAFGGLDVARVEDREGWCIDVDTPEDAEALAATLARL
ncbi:NTP transferase domain-containing protein [Trueperella bernardiae]|uniref:NTP transferase domain-containing protein n=1 Tax=Trueperella bernardiae TaxID=59561 RepID=A0AAW6ZAL0_9ACTO|nr:NTP transferase domain-containing protein [Trueperella bernardiae]MDK8600879.1 NTP transferase domain-containing protein [Trueperella bernardiae]